jgi:hypothetical protein
MASAFTWMSIIILVLFLGVMSGLWAGLTGLWKSRRGPARSLMAIGIILSTIGPICLFAIIWIARSPNSGSSSFAAIQIFNVIGGLLIPIGLILFSVGFALHGFAVARLANRAAELELLTTAMSEEINRLREGGPVP